MSEIVSEEQLAPIRLPVLFPVAEVSARRTFQRSDIHIWRLDTTPAHAPVHALWPLLDEDEQARAARFRFENDRLRFVAAHGLVRCVLGWYLQEPPQRLRFAFGPRGKPAITAKGASDICFNLSHAADVALLGLARRREIGIDIEVVRAGLAQEGIAERFFAPAEVAELRSLPVTEQDEAFFACWTRKEAYVKARGDGLAMALSEFQVSLAPGNPPRLTVGYGSTQRPQRWSLYDLGLRPTYCAALVVEGNKSALCWYTPEDAKSAPRPRY